MTLEFVSKNWYLFLALVVILALLIADPIRRRTSGVRSVSPLQMPQLTRDPSVIVDVSEPGEYKKGHLPQAINIPLKTLLSDQGKLAKHKEKNIIIVCNSGNRSASAARHLAKHGFEKVYNLSGGQLAWAKENLPIEKG